MFFLDNRGTGRFTTLQICLGLSAAALPATLHAQVPLPPINTPGDYVGEPLALQDLIRPAFIANFGSVPALGTGAVPLASPPLPFNDPSFQWRAAYVYATPELGAPANIPPGDPDPAFSFFPGELNVYPNADAITATGDSPFSAVKGTLGDGYLNITASVTPPAYLSLLPTGFATNYISGAINSYPFSQQYGYFEMSAKMPAGAGLWPAFWLLPQDNSWPPEIDVMEMLGNNPFTLYATVHTVLNSPGPTNASYAVATRTPDLTKAFHTYGVDWGPFKILWYFDRKLVFSYPTPSDCHKPFYIIANMTIGGPTSWGGAPTSQTQFPASMEIAYISAWQRYAYLKYLP